MSDHCHVTDDVIADSFPVVQSNYSRLVRDLEARGSVSEREDRRESLMRSSSARTDRTHGGRDIQIGKRRIGR